MDTDEKKKNSSAEEKQSGRRKLLKSVVAGGGAATVAKALPDQWARPVIDAVLLPSHAQTSITSRGGFVASGPIAMNEAEQNVAEQGFSEELLEFFAPAAKAGAGGTPISNMALTANDAGDSFLCAEFNATTEVIAVQIQNPGTSASFTSNDCLFGADVLGGNFVDGTGWQVDIRPFKANVTTVTLVQGVSGCDGSETPGHCYR